MKNADQLIVLAHRALDNNDEAEARSIYLEMADFAQSIGNDIDDEFSDVMCELAPLALAGL